MQNGNQKGEQARRARGKTLEMNEFRRRNSGIFGLGDSLFQKSELDESLQHQVSILNRKKSIVNPKNGKEVKQKAFDPGDNDTKNEQDLSSQKDQKKKKKEPVPLKDLIEMFFSEEYIEDFNCSKCKKKVIIKKTYRIVKQPEILIISLKRFEYYPKIKKINRSILINTDDLDLRKYFHKGSTESPIIPNQVESGVLGREKSFFKVQKHLDPKKSDLSACTYEMRAYIEHHGNMNKGHYVSYVKQSDDTDQENWFLKNDDSVYLVKMHHEYLKQSNKYVYSIFYQLQKTHL
jgi:uncharacterized UBP type Zn finger protein